MNNIDNLCKKVNAKYNLKNGSIGSIYHYADMCENSIVQIMNEYGGTRQLVYGTNKTLETFLNSILSDKTILKFWNINKI